jgi:DNA topoisomerase I
MFESVANIVMLIIVESPAKAKTIQKIVGAKHTVMASIGHIRRITNASKTKDGRKLEISGIDIENDFDPLYETDPLKNDVVSKLKKAAKSATDGILFASDADREGESISWHVASVLGVKDINNIKRLEFHEITKSAIEHAMAHPRALNVTLVEAQKARQVLDKLVGYKLSPVLWTIMGNNNLSAGRVQTPALALLYEREKEILKFNPEEYWDIFGDFDNSKSLVKPKIRLTDEDKKIVPFFTLTKFENKSLPKIIESQAKSTDILKSLVNNTSFTIETVTTKIITNRPKPPFTTSSLQQAASSKLGMSPKLTMRLAQSLYEGISIDGSPTALITYMRTDSMSLSAESISKARTYIQNNHPQYLPSKPNFYSSKSRNAQEAHEAIRPIDPLLSPDKLRSKLEIKAWKLYDLIWRQMLASQMLPEKRELTTMTLTNSDGSAFSGSVSKQIEAGFRTIQPTKNIEKEFSVPLVIGTQLFLSEVVADQSFTAPPSRYSAASLIKKLESLGIGRPSTYASIISTLQDREYVDGASKSMQPTALGMKIAELLTTHFPDVTSSEMTKNMEDDLDKISNGDKKYLEVIKPFWTKFKAQVEGEKDKVYENKQKYKTLSDDKLDNPFGTGKLILKLGRFGEYWQSEDDPSKMYPKMFKEIAAIEEQIEKDYGDKVKGLISTVSKKPLILRVSKSSLNPYVATEDYRVGSPEKAISIDKLNEKGWTQSVVDELFTTKSTGRSFGKKRSFAKKTKRTKK